MHQTLYRKYRPKKFSDLVGQDHIKAVLRGGIMTQKTSHAYLFAGSRGTGKTTTARIFAKALNCLDPQDGQPCDKCPSCLLINDDKAVDIIEVDAASNRGIDEIRDLRERVRFLPSMLKKKVYIIDEVHMLTTEAFNALLKTLEEPPDHAIFILATTEVHKIPATIQSRVLRLNFNLGSREQIFQYLKSVAEKEKINITDDAIKLIALTADGGYRDALSALEQAVHSEAEITEEVVRDTLGLGEAKTTDDLVKAITASDQQKAFELLDNLNNQGTSASHIHRLLVENFRRILRQSFETDSGQSSQIIKILENLIEITPTIRTSPLPFLPLEIIVAKFSISEPSLPSQSSSSLPSSPPSPPSPSLPWPQVLEKLQSHNNSLSYLLKGATVDEISETELKVSVRYKFHTDRLMETKNRQIIEQIITEVYDKKLIFTCSTVRPSSPSSASSSEDLAQAAEEILGV